MKRVHFTDKYLLDPRHPVTVNLIGAGGTGSQVLTNLARIDVTLRALRHPGLHVTVYDPDVVTEANIGRQLFSLAEIGLNKAECLVTRINRFFGNGWDAKPEYFPGKGGYVSHANITISCTDTVSSRLEIWNCLNAKRIQSYTDHRTPLYWLDAGNSQTTGQVILGTIGNISQPRSQKYKTVKKLKTVTELVKYNNLQDDDSGPSCSLGEALEKQDLFINSTLAQLGCNIIWKMFRQGFIDHHGIYLNLETMNVNPLKL